ncbi:MAG: MIR motif-containing protein [Olpidium bornovanus]|uniref:MIR motif-containing protein n=1 Tax=Olpidium bornovanus TaxID=278681 RepID=A0A8H7ZS30_9FUNG|nr:MAG: MIR motif-containing protein [Olpidium bornovanus]
MPRKSLIALLLVALYAAGAAGAKQAGDGEDAPELDPEPVLIPGLHPREAVHIADTSPTSGSPRSAGSGSRQQSVTGFAEVDDPNSLWKLKAEHGKDCRRGEPVPCGGIVRLLHVNTGRLLHSHLHQSPLSRQQEVSAFEGENKDDNWKIVCQNTTDTHWTREGPVALYHVSTGLHLSASPRHVYSHPIPGQLEVSAAKSAGRETVWAAQEGFYFESNLDIY